MNDELWHIIRPAIARLRASVMAVAFGVFAGFGLFAATVWLVVRGGTEFGEERVVGPHLGLLSNYFPGYSVTWGGAFIGFFYAALTGAVLGFAVAWLYNFFAFRNDAASNGSRSSTDA